MNSAKETADIQSETADMVSPDRRRRVSSPSADRDRSKNDDNNNVESTATDNGHHHQHYEQQLAREDDRLHRMAKCPSRNTEAGEDIEADEEEEEEEREDGEQGRGDFSKTSPLRISIGEERASVEDLNIEALSKSLHIKDEIINIIANSKHLLVNGENQPQEIAAKNERVSGSWFVLSVCSVGGWHQY